MATKSTIRWQHRVNRPFNEVHDAMAMNASHIFKQATDAAQQKSEDNAADLHAKVAGFEFHQDVVIDVKSYTEIASESGEKLVISLTWKAASDSSLLPVMDAKIHVSPLEEQQKTMVDFRGEYEPPLGLLGQAFDTVVGHRVAEDSVKHLLEELAMYLETHADEQV